MSAQPTKTIEQQMAEARAEQAVARRLPNAYLIKAPFKVEKDSLPVHDHVNAEGRHIEGGTIKLIDGEGYTSNPDHAEWIARYWGPDGYTVTQVDRSQGEDGNYIVSLRELSDLVAQAQAKGDR